MVLCDTLWESCQQLISGVISLITEIEFPIKALLSALSPSLALCSTHLLKFCEDTNLHYVYETPRKMLLGLEMLMKSEKIQYIILRGNVGQSSWHIFVDIRPVSHTSFYRQLSSPLPPTPCKHIHIHKETYAQTKLAWILPRG